MQKNMNKKRLWSTLLQKRDIAIAIILSLVTCGIYGIYWMIVLTNDVGRLSDEPGFQGGIAFLLSVITCGIYGIYWAYQLGKYVAKAQAMRGFTQPDNSLLFVVLSIFGLGIVAFAIAQNDVNQMV
jgi:hypothetical protein